MREKIKGVFVLCGKKSREFYSDSGKKSREFWNYNMSKLLTKQPDHSKKWKENNQINLTNISQENSSL